MTFGLDSVSRCLQLLGGGGARICGHFVLWGPEAPEAEQEKKVKSVYGTTDEMVERAKEGYFVRDPEWNLVYCPAGEILRQKCIKKNGNIRYTNKNACKHCKNRNKCYKGKNEWKEIDFTKDTLEKACKEWLE